ncbi:microtubule-associated protein futsch isoform X2 [Aethina tumida]|uniref:microtubule-associated protein futsch isoform X2 n=1 Tax=Aethina tumida TaxID=116153 RepID=UPI0021478458|nr:microtubule-associated protein futsch isoform X2 [Aethina tumida]
MGRRARKTRWRTLSIADEQSDSEESNVAPGQRLSKYHQTKTSYLLTRSSYSDRSSPRRRYQYDSTRSSSTTSETKITFNEDEYTKITTPRQDVLFKKGYLNKPKTYQSQTSTGNSTTSTGNSTGNGTPDYQLTDIEYESQFVFPNGFVDQNGIYYVNSYEPYPLMVYNPPQYYPDYSRTKRLSTGSLTESMSPNTEEASSSQDLNEVPGNVSEYPVCNMVYPEYYVNPSCPTQDAQSDTRRLKKRRRRRSSKTMAGQADSTSEYTDDEESTDRDAKPQQSLSNTSTCTSPNTDPTPDDCPKYDLKPDAEEFVPRAYRPPEYPVAPGYVRVVPMHLVPPNAFIPFGYPPNVIGYVPQYVPKQQGEEGVAPSQEVQAEPAPQQADDAQPQELEEVKEREESKETVQKPEQSPAKLSTKPDFRNNRHNNNNKFRNTPERNNHRRNYDKERQTPERYYSNNNNTARKQNYSSPKRITKDDKLNYSEKVKEPVPQADVVPKKPEPKSPQKTSQWISVSSKKKRKNKVVEEADDFYDDEVDDSGQEFESYDVTQLVDVVPPSKVEAQTIESILTDIKVNETANLENNLVSDRIPVVEEIERQMVAAQAEDAAADDVDETKKTKKKSKKGTQKPLTKRVIITDLCRPESPVKETKDDKDKDKEVKVKEAEPPQEVEPSQEVAKEEVAKEVVKEEKVEGEKKQKKKKKKSQKASTSSVSSSTTTLNATDDTYDFLEENDAKTNVEVYQELDKLIQKGMYSSLETKMRTLNIERNDDFFESVLSKIRSPEAGEQKRLDFTRILQSTRRLCTEPTALHPLRQMDFF